MSMEQIIDLLAEALEKTPAFGRVTLEIVFHAGKLTRVEVSKNEAFQIQGGAK